MCDVMTHSSVAVSPDTMAVLQEADFSTLPPPEPVSLSMAEE